MMRFWEVVVPASIVAMTKFGTGVTGVLLVLVLVLVLDVGKLVGG